MKIMRKIIEIDQDLCNGCGQCVPSCAEGALVIVDGKAQMRAEKYCDGLGACLGECPTGALQIIEREADDFDEAAVEALLHQQKIASPPVGGCPSARLQSFGSTSPCQMANVPSQHGEAGQGSALGHWPVQIRLVPATAPFLKNADLLVAADCVPVACAEFQSRLLAGKAVMIGCPKFDDVAGYIEKFTEIFKTSGVHSLALAIMEVPCCGGMRQIIRQALSQADSRIPVEEVIISTRGAILSRAAMQF